TKWPALPASFTQIEFSDVNDAGNAGHFVVNGVVQPANQGVFVTPAQLSTVTFTPGAAGTSDTLWVRASDASGFGAWQFFTATASAASPSPAPAPAPSPAPAPVPSP